MNVSFISFIYILLALLGIGILIFIHELAHYFMARHVGMKVEAFGIGFGKPIYTWEKDGVKWHICWLPFGGYVKIAGMEAVDGKEPHEISDGFFGKSPLDRIKVAFVGPLANIVLAFLLFLGLWVAGGREKKFSDFTARIGWVDPHSALYYEGVRPGDIITSYDGHPFQKADDHLYSAMVSGTGLEVRGYHIDDEKGQRTPFTVVTKAYQHPLYLEKGILTSGILNPASYVIYNPPAKQTSAIFPEGSPMTHSGIQPNDRIIWADGEVIYSLASLSHFINEGKALLTIERDGKNLLARVPRVRLQELKIEPIIKDEFTDWQYEAQLGSVKSSSLIVIPYNLTSDAVVENELKFIDADNQKEAFPEHPFASIDNPLQAGDKIIAVDGTPIRYAYQLLFQIQTHQVNIIVENSDELLKSISWKKADEDYNQDINWSQLHQITDSIGTSSPITSTGSLRLLNPIIPKMRSELATTPESQASLKAELMHKKKEIEGISDNEKRTHAINSLDQQEKQLLLGLPFVQDRLINYNPFPTELFSNVGREVGRSLFSLVTGSLNPKWLSGPIGIVQVMQNTWMISVKEGLFWMGVISLNLGILNLLPIPVLDGGHICMALYEIVTRKKLKAKTMEKLVIPFSLLLISFFVFLTYHDLTRLFHSITK